MTSELRDRRLYLHRRPEERDKLLGRLSRIEGQVRGLHGMVSEDRYCGEELQLATAVLAAVREVMRLLVAQHVDAGLDHISANPEAKAAVMDDIAAVLRPLLRET